jgi:hypothetical protein
VEDQRENIRRLCAATSPVLSEAWDTAVWVGCCLFSLPAFWIKTATGAIMTGMFLNQEDLETLTGRKYRSCQRRWLEQAGIPYFISATGRIQVLKALVEQKMGMAAKGKPNTQVSEPRWDVFSR